MGQPLYRRCKVCRRDRAEVGEMSWTRLCPECGEARLWENVMGLHEHRGSAFERWRRAMAACVGAMLLDDLEALVQTEADASGSDTA